MNCIEWWGAMWPNGYGRVSQHRRQYKAHRFIWEQCFGPIEPGLILHHTCENKACVNPEHLELVTRAQHNTEHSAPSHCKHGHEYTEANTDIRPSGWRRCRTCHRIEAKERYHARKK